MSDREALGVGLKAGVVVSVVLAITAFVGPWRLFSVVGADGPLPMTLTEGPGGNGIFSLNALAAAVVGGAAAAHYRRHGDPGDDYVSQLAAGIISSVAVAFLVLIELALLGFAVAGALDGGSATSAVAGILLALVLGLFAWALAAIVFVFYLGLPATLGAWVGAKIVDLGE